MREIKKRVDIMVDLETLGLGDDASIIQIGAIRFDIKTGEVLSEFNQYVDITRSTPTVDGGTLLWWLNTNSELLLKILNGGTRSICVSLMKFNEWIESQEPEDEHTVYLWGNGILFDNAKIKHNMLKNNIEYPIGYKNDRDVRTLLEMASIKTGCSESEIKGLINNDGLVEHDAIDDCIYQARLVSMCFNMLMEEN